VDSAGNAYITGQTFSTDYPTWNAHQSQRYGNSDAFVTKILAATTPPLAASVSGGNLLLSWTQAGQQWPNSYNIQTTTNLLATNDWVTVTNPAIATNNGNFIYTFGRTNSAQFFRLTKP